MTTTTRSPRSSTSRVVRPRSPARTEILVGLAVLAVFVVLSFVAPLIVGHSADQLVGAPFQAPSPKYPFGTDSIGRDVFVRTFTAVHVDFLVAAAGALSSLVIGTLLGMLAGVSRRGIWGTLLLRITDALIAVPFPLLVLVIVMTVGNQVSVFGAPPGVVQVLTAILVIGWAIYARIARTEASGLRSREYVIAAELMGYSKARIIFVHIMPRVLAATATYAVADAVMIVGFVAALPFLGAGVPPPTPEWGSMMYEARASLVTGWWQVIFPGLALTISAVSASLIGDALVDRSDSRLRRQR